MTMNDLSVTLTFTYITGSRQLMDFMVRSLEANNAVIKQQTGVRHNIFEIRTKFMLQNNIQTRKNYQKVHF